MQKIGFFLLFLFVKTCFAQQSDFKNIDFTKADNRAKIIKSKKLLKLNELTFKLTENLETDVEKFRAIYVWICSNIANDYRLYALNDRKRNRFEKDSIRLNKWNSRFKKLLFKKLLKKKRTICTGYAYLLKEMANIAGIEAKIVNGFGRTGAIDLEKINANHTWNVVKLNEKWYLCDPTWSAGISYPDEGKFVFQLNDGYFLTDPALFIKNHFPVDVSYTLLENNSPSIEEFIEMPLFYGKGYDVFEKDISPFKMHHEIKQNETFTFQYKLKKELDLNSIKLVFYNGSTEKSIKPETSLQENILTIKHQFKRTGFYDLHLYAEGEIIVTYTFRISK